MKTKKPEHWRERIKRNDNTNRRKFRGGDHPSLLSRLIARFAEGVEMSNLKWWLIEMRWWIALAINCALVAVALWIIDNGERSSFAVAAVILATVSISLLIVVFTMPLLGMWMAAMYNSLNKWANGEESDQ